MINSNLCELVKQMKIKDDNNKKNILKQIENEKTLTGKCVLARNYLNPQSTDIETIYRKDLKIVKSLNSRTGNGYKNGIYYEIKSSIHAKKSKLNFVQIRPDRYIDYYILIGYNMYKNNNIGKSYIFKIPSQIMYNLIIDYGSYAHGTCEKLGKITKDNIKGWNRKKFRTLE